MTSGGRIMVLRGAGGPGAGVADQVLADALRALDPHDAVDADTAVAQFAGAGGVDAPLAVIGPDVERPVSAAVDLRRADGSLGIAFVVAAGDADAMEVRIGLVPELRGATVHVAGGSARDLESSLRKAAVAAARRREVRGALAAINRQLMRRSPEPASQRESISESYLATLTRHVPEAIVSVDEHGRVVALNDAATRTFRTSRPEIEGALLGDAIPSDDAALQQIVEDALGGETRTGQELTVRAEEGRSRFLSVTAAPVRDHSGRIVGAVLLARDVTEQRLTEERLRELQKAQSLATLAGGVAHDFNNLLVGVRGWAELAADDPRDLELVTTALDRIQTAAGRAADLARSMLVYSGRGRFELVPVDLAELAREMSDLLEGSISPKTTLVLDLAEPLPDVEADASQLRQVVMNLVTNASESLGDEAGTITLRTAEVAGPAEVRDDQLPDGRYVVLEVSDTGPGMDAATVRRVFEPFFTTKFEGRGLGLAASHGIVRAHGGALLADSEPGEGARFRMLLPVLEER